VAEQSRRAEALKAEKLIADTEVRVLGERAIVLEQSAFHGWVLCTFPDRERHGRGWVDPKDIEAVPPRRGGTTTGPPLPPTQAEARTAAWQQLSREASLPDLRAVATAPPPPPPPQRLPRPERNTPAYVTFVKPYKLLWQLLTRATEHIMDWEPTQYARLNMGFRVVAEVAAILAFLAAAYVVFVVQVMVVMTLALGLAAVVALVFLAALLAGSGGGGRRRGRTGFRMRSSVPLPGPFYFKLW
jgi:hypothetical protein